MNSRVRGKNVSRLHFKARCTRSRHPKVLLVGKAEVGEQEARYYALNPQEAVVLAGELMESARQAYRLSTADASPTDSSPPVTLRADFCRHSPEHCPLPVCLCRPYPISAERVQLLYDLRKLVAPFSFRGFWIATVSDSQVEAPTEAVSPHPARPGSALPVEGR